MDVLRPYSERDADVSLRSWHWLRFVSSWYKRSRPARIDNEREPLAQHANRDEEFGC